MKQYIIDAFTDKLFGGNPAAICILDKWLTDELMLNIARENNLSETAFVVNEGEKYRLRWFTPVKEIDLCGHATLACAYVIMNELDASLSKVVFNTLSGELSVKKSEDLYEMDFPAYQLRRVQVTDEIIEAMGEEPQEAYMGRDLLCVFNDEDAVKQLSADMKKLKHLDGLLVHATARGKDSDCVSRSFAPKLGVDGDPVCGSGHCHIVPYWANRLKKKNITAYQASKRGGMLYCKMIKENRVAISGKAVIYCVSELNIEKLLLRNADGLKSSFA